MVDCAVRLAAHVTPDHVTSSVLPLLDLLAADHDAKVRRHTALKSASVLQYVAYPGSYREVEHLLMKLVADGDEAVA